MSTYGEIVDIKLWKEDQIDFIVPLEWKEGKAVVWIEKEKRDDPYVILKSNPFEIKVASRWSFYPTQEEIEGSASFVIKVIKKIKRFHFLQEELLK